MKDLKYILLIFSVFILMLFNSCEEFIDLKPLDKISMSNYWKTSTDLGNYTLQFYPNAFPGKNMVAEVGGNSDDMIVASPSTILNGERAKRTGNWQSEWSNIRNVNIFFENYKKCGDSFESYKHYVGEAHFFGLGSILTYYKCMGMCLPCTLR